MDQRELTQKELSRHNGKNGTPVWIAYGGLVYDLSNSFLWRKGKHQALHASGADLTEEIEQAPHGPEMLDKFPIVGILGEEGR